MSKTATQPKPALQQVTEQITDWQTEALIVDAANRTVRHVALTGLQSKNGYHYSQQALEQALPLYENKPVFLDHAINKTQPYQRSTRDLVGTVTNPRFENGRIIADIQVLDTEAGRTFLALAESNLLAVGMSQVVIAERKPGSEPGQLIVQRIHEVVSIDAVMFPATTSNLHEQTEARFSGMAGSLEQFLAEFDQQLATHLAEQLPVQPNEIQRVALFAEQVLFHLPQADTDAYYAIRWQLQDEQSLTFQFDSKPQPVSLSDLAEHTWNPMQQAIHNCFQTEARNEQTQQLLTEIEQLRSRRDELLAQLTASQADQLLQQEIDDLLAEAELPAYAATALFREQLQQAESTSKRKSLIAERVRLLFDLKQQLPVSQLRTLTDPPVYSDEAIVSAIRKPSACLSAHST